ncbi:hypothetical protein SIAM614_19436 [Stappia aggregata IAM 12614]|uniref:DUF4169 family protein n=1 Tax=Roseibium aggregatum (strain ATCC 25650 / DSM 13394 / JCM 20685 / NBRC 16684 / NCIMB 2208 / IAM 12614 / B1) TaxID=384765 RepID=A0NVL4_ROSAI|nr:DUF4169 family protein [Roseibium aggregatum]EAV43029.1 hypothetical protein SIAM614_19436 [Stappia aggregata IAM 12614] [Roseibium aggregatum IAM 12614]
MSAEIINLRMARKQKKREDKDKTAEDNRRKYGRSKAERDAARQRRETLETHVDGHLLGKRDGPNAEHSDPETTDADKFALEPSGQNPSGPKPSDNGD